MPPVPAVPGAKVVRAFEEFGWTLVRIRGSHHVMRSPTGLIVAVPVHSSRDVPRGTLCGILRKAGMSVQELIDVL